MSVKTEKISERASQLRMCGDDIAGALGVNPSTYYRKMSSGGKAFTVEQAQCLVDVLGFTKDEAIDIFFADKLAETRENSNTTS